jgi:hypothetical protein
MGNGFANRLSRGVEFQNEVQEIVKRNGWEFVPMGAENIAPNVHRMMSKMENPDNTVRFVRYMPDGFAVHPEKEEAFFLDCKHSDTIEKDAYINYLTYAGEDRRVYVFIKSQDQVYCVPLKKLQFQDSHEVVRKYPNPMPVDSEGWIAPREWPDEKYLAWKSRYRSASGTAYKYIDFERLEKYIIKAPTC